MKILFVFSESLSLSPEGESSESGVFVPASSSTFPDLGFTKSLDKNKSKDVNTSFTDSDLDRPTTESHIDAYNLIQPGENDVQVTNGNPSGFAISVTNLNKEDGGSNLNTKYGSDHNQVEFENENHINENGRFADAIKNLENEDDLFVNAAEWKKYEFRCRFLRNKKQRARCRIITCFNNSTDCFFPK